MLFFTIQLKSTLEIFQYSAQLLACYSINKGATILTELHFTNRVPNIIELKKNPGPGLCVCGSFFSSSLFLFFDRCTESLHKKIVHQGLLNYKKKYGNESKNNEKTNREKKIVEKIQWLISNAFRKQSFMFEMQTSQLAYSERKEITQLC